MRAARQDGGDVHRIRAGGVGDVEVAVELVQQLVVQVHRDRVERPARHVHLVARHALGVVVHRQGVAQLDPEGEILLRSHALQRLDQLDRHGVLQVVLEDRVGDHDLGEAQPVVQDVQHPLLAQERGVHLHDRVQPALLQGVAGDALDLVGRAAVHRGEGDAVGQLRRDLDVGELRELAGDDLLDLAELLRGVGHRVHEPGHAGRLDPLQVVADAHVEDRAERRALPAQHPAEDVEDGPGDDVLVRRLLQLELLRPLDVVALVGHVDAGPRDHQLVHDLHGLQLDEPAAAQPRRDDVLAELGVRPCGRADGGRQVVARPAKVRHGKGCVRFGRVEERAVDIEDGSLALVFHQDAPKLRGEGLDLHDVGHKLHCSLI